MLFQSLSFLECNSNSNMLYTLWKQTANSLTTKNNFYEETNYKIIILEECELLDRDESIVFIVKEAWYFPNTQHSLPSGLP
jgi:hypothetical protein